MTDCTCNPMVFGPKNCPVHGLTQTHPIMYRWYFTFGCGSPLANYYVVIEATDELAARERMVSLFSGHWASCYSEPYFQQRGPSWNLQRLFPYGDASLRLCTNHAPIDTDMYNNVYHGGRSRVPKE